MNIKFIDENTVKIEASVDYHDPRPPIEKRETVKRGVYIDKFLKKYPSYEIENISGPMEICGFRKEEQSKGTWILTVSKIQKQKNSNTTSHKRKKSAVTNMKKGA